MTLLLLILIEKNLEPDDLDLRLLYELKFAKAV